MKNGKLKKCVLFALAIGISMGVSSQEKFKLKLETGFTKSVLQTDLSNQIDSRINRKSGFDGKLLLEYNLIENLSLAIGLQNTHKVYQFQKTGNETKPAHTQSKYNYSFVGIPIQASYYLFNNPFLNDGFYGQIGVGIYYNYLASIQREGIYPILSELQLDYSINHGYVKEKYNFKDNENRINRNYFGMSGNIKIGYSYKHLDFSLGYNYHKDISTTNKTSYRGPIKAKISPKLLSESFTLGIGYTF